MVYKQREFKFLKYINIMLEKYSSYILGFNLNCLKNSILEGIEFVIAEEKILPKQN